MEKEALKKVLLFLIVLIVLLVFINSFSGIRFAKDSEISSKATSNIKDIYAPVVNINPVAKGSSVVTGSVRDDSDIKWVKIKVNDGTWQNAQGFESWSADLDLLRGENAVHIQAGDVFDNISPVNSVKVFY